MGVAAEAVVPVSRGGQQGQTPHQGPHCLANQGFLEFVLFPPVMSATFSAVSTGVSNVIHAPSITLVQT